MILLMLICVSFSSYVLMSPFKVQYEITSGDFSEDNAEMGKEYPKELIDIVGTAEFLTAVHIQNSSSYKVYSHVKLPTQHVPPNTPPPNFG